MNKIFNLLTSMQNKVIYLYYYLSKERKMLIHFNIFFKVKFCIRWLTFSVKQYSQLSNVFPICHQSVDFNAKVCKLCVMISLKGKTTV